MSTLAVRRDSGPFVTYITPSGEEVRVEIQPSGDGFMPVSGERPLGRLDYLFGPVFSTAEELIRGAREVQANQVTIRFGIKITGGGQAVVSRTVDEGNFEVSLNWDQADHSINTEAI